MKSKIKNIIFDWSGPIKNLSENHFWVVQKMFEHLGRRNISLRELKNNYEEPYMNFWHKYFPELTIEEEQRIYRNVLADKDRPESIPYKNIVSLVKKIKKSGCRMIVLSSDFPETILHEIKDFGLENIFDEVVHSVHDKSEIIHELIRKHDYRPGETVFVGDSSNEVEAGKNAGIKTISVTWGFTSEEKLKLASPDYLVQNVRELEKILLK